MSDIENTTEELEGWVEANTDGDRVKNFTCKEGTTTLRFFPGTKSLAGKPPAKFRSIYFIQGRNPRNAGSFRSFPILSLVEKDWNRNGMIVQTDPIYDKREEVKNKIKEIEARGLAQKRTKADIAKATQPYNIWLRNHGEQGRYIINAMDLSGNVGFAQLAATVWKKLKAKIKDLEGKGHTPLGKKGVYFDIIRTGTGFDTDYDVQPHMLDREDGSTVLAFHTVTKEVWGKVMALPDIADDIERLRRDVGVMQEIAELPLNADPSEVNRILGVESDSQQEGQPDDGQGGGEPLDDGEFGSSSEVKRSATADEEAAALAASAEVSARAAKAAAEKAAAAKQKQAAPATTATPKTNQRPPVTQKPAVKAPPAEEIGSESFDDVFSQ